eukprot:CAMPEP_0206539546 /NCGR_PEP_ID=MMETSP0325_2-20121206/8489_1 /ASSEMBLY_ACC=CAM_ASM_000347 /TAXON_ID=2866 /ORGANISM="Crypthecodinium cohnii, Strain Seligo" /LENGTH=167 /DNA_ID=CAMNT_0054037129 /DNA_START=210 /DNA_END=710 /DNA_ORIENTATION=+
MSVCSLELFSGHLGLHSTDCTLRVNRPRVGVAQNVNGIARLSDLNVYDADFSPHLVQSFLDAVHVEEYPIVAASHDIAGDDVIDSPDFLEKATVAASGSWQIEEVVMSKVVPHPAAKLSTRIIGATTQGAQHIPRDGRTASWPSSVELSAGRRRKRETITAMRPTLT